MKKTYFKGLPIRLTLFSVLIGVVFIVHGCRKESKLGSLSLADSVSMAKTWYETTYPVSTGSSSSLSTLSVNGNTGIFDYSQHIKPDWVHNDAYHRLGKSVIEIPMDASTNFKMDLRKNATGPIVYTKENTKTSFVILHDATGYQAYVMTIMADVSYINGDPTKLAKNTYRHRDANFTGLVVYSTLKGQFIRAYAYNNGILLPPTGTSTNSAALKAQGLTTLCSGPPAPAGVQQKVNSVQKVNDYEDCVYYYYGYYVDDVLIYLEHRFTICTDCPDGGSPSDPGGSGTTPDPCNTPTSPTNPTDPGDGSGGGGGTPAPVSITKLTVNDVGDGGMGDPAGCNISTISDSDLANATPVIDSKPPIDPVKYKNCFNDGKIASSYVMTIYIDQPNPGHKDQFMIYDATSFTAPGITLLSPQNATLDVGHAFVGFTKNNTDGTSVTQVLGFYPKVSTPYGKGAIKDDTSHPYSVSSTAIVSSTDFNAALNDVISDGANSYYNVSNISGNEYNCTDAALSWMTAAGAILPNGVARGVFSNTPGDYGQALRSFPYTNSTSTNITAPISHGPCN